MRLANFLRETIFKELADLVSQNSVGIRVEVSRDGDELHVNIDGVPETLILVERDR